jgi:transposase
MVIPACVLEDAVRCRQCESKQAELDAARARIVELEAETNALRAQLHEVAKLAELQAADLERYRKAYESVRPNCPERVPAPQLQLAFERVLESFGQRPADNDTAENSDNPSSSTTGEPAHPQDPKRNRHRHGRRALDLSSLPMEPVRMDPPEVIAAGGVGFEKIGEEVSYRVAFKPAGYVRLCIIRTKWVPAGPTSTDREIPESEEQTSPIVIAPLPDSVWPKVMADPSAIANIIISKYDDILPLYRQERISQRQGFVIPRSTQCGWLGPAYEICVRVTNAMFLDAIGHAHCIATDATGAPVRAPGKCDKWHMFVFIADRSHVLFRYTEEHSSAAVSNMLAGFKGYVLADASKIFDTLYRDHEMTEVACWYHQRRYLWRSLETDPDKALEGMSIISKLFEIERECKDLPLPEKTSTRAARAGPLLDLLDKWVDRHRGHVDPRGPLDAAITYYDNQRDALRRFLEDGRLSLHNSGSEQQLRNLALGRHAWLYFANETGLKWYATFRSLIASCHMHDLNPQLYLEQLLRLAPHWPVTRMLELAPKYWNRTLAGLDDHQRLIITRPWELPAPPPTVQVAPIAAE